MKVSIIIPNYNGNETLTDCLNSVFDYIRENSSKNSSLFENYEVILVDNNSSDNSAQKAKQKFPQIKLIRLPQNQGFARAVNKGVEQSQGKFVFLLNNDALIDKNCLKILLGTFEADKNIGIAGPRIVDPQGNLEIAGFRLCPWLGFAIYDKSSPSKQKEVDWVSGAAMMIKRQVFEKIALFDEQCFFYFEDTDFCLRAKKAGYKIFYQPKAKVVHLGGVSSKKITQKKLNRYWYRGKFRCLFKNGRPWHIFASILAQLVVYPYKVLIRKDKTGKIQIKSFLWAIKS